MLETEVRLVSTQQAQVASASDLGRIVGALFRHRMKMLTVGVTVFGLIVLWTFCTPKRFTSTMILLVQNARGNEIVSAAQTGNTATVNDVTEEQLNSEVAVLYSDDILDEVVDPGWAARTSGSTSNADLEAHQIAVRQLRSNLSVSPVRASRAITIKLVAASPQAAKENLNRLLQAFLAKQKDLGRLPGASSFFDKQVAQYESALASARRDLAAYQNRYGFVSLSDEEASLAAKEQGLQSSVMDTEVQINDVQHRIEADKQQLAAMPQRLPTVNRSSTDSGTIDQLNVLLINLQNKRTELLTKFKPTDYLVQDVNQQIADTMAGIRHATTLSPHETASDVNPLWQSTERDLSNSEVSLKGLIARRDSLSRQLASLRSNLNQAELQAVDYNKLQQKVTELQNTYRTFVEKRDNSRMNDLMDAQQWLNVAVVQYPTFSVTPSHPLPAMYLSLGFITAMLLGGCAVFLSETMRQQIATPAELELISRYPVLATIPFTTAVRQLEGSAASSVASAAQHVETGLAIRVEPNLWPMTSPTATTKHWPHA